MPHVSPLRLLVVDDHPLFREGLLRTLGSEPGLVIVAEAENSDVAIACWQQHQPDVGLIDISMPDVDGIETVRRIRAFDPGAQLLMLSSSEHQHDVLAALDAGAAGYVTKSIRYADLLEAIHEVAKGGRPVSPAIARQLASRERQQGLTPREQEVLVLLGQGLPLQAIADRLSITERTVRAHVTALKVKLDAANTAQIVARGFQGGLLDSRSQPG